MSRRFARIGLTLAVGLVALPFAVGLSGLPRDPGSLVATTSQSTVGVLLDEIPPSMRARVAETHHDATVEQEIGGLVGTRSRSEPAAAANEKAHDPAPPRMA